MKTDNLYTAITEAAQAHGLPWWLLYTQIERESDFDTKAESGCGAIGLMQIMPATARSCGVDPETLWDPAANIRLGAQILADNVGIFRDEDGDERLKFGLAAYNGGPGYVINAQSLAQREGLDPAQWDSIKQTLPRSVAYVGGDWKHPDAGQIIGYVDWIWMHYELRKDRPIPGGGA